ncbi:MAG: SM-like, degradation of cytoplasmic mRNAs and positively regulates transcription initiation [Geoglossum umbratile]|nr:MAG: SM-like, degradation of cytoplasmic mRNAs and positively regulates transcription initiation [Geoglossum umbratile]
MEHLTLQDTPPPGAQNAHPPPPQTPLGPQQLPQLPPQMFTTAAQLLDLTDSEVPLSNPRTEKLLVSLRDGRKLIGVLRSWDQFANLLLQDTIERIYVQTFYADNPQGVYVVRGENVLLLGEIDLDKEDDIPAPYQKAPLEQVLALQKKEKEERKRSDKARQRKLMELGFEVENMGEALL